MNFAEKLSKLAEACSQVGSSIQHEKFLPINENYHFLGLIPSNRIVGRVWVARTVDCWRVMLSEPGKPDDSFWGADYSMTSGDDAQSALLAVWIRDADNWERCTGAEIDTICDRIQNAIDSAYDQYTDA